MRGIVVVVDCVHGAVPDSPDASSCGLRLHAAMKGNVFADPDERLHGLAWICGNVVICTFARSPVA